MRFSSGTDPRRAELSRNPHGCANFRRSLTILSENLTIVYRENNPILTSSAQYSDVGARFSSRQPSVRTGSTGTRTTATRLSLFVIAKKIHYLEGT